MGRGLYGDPGAAGADLHPAGRRGGGLVLGPDDGRGAGRRRRRAGPARDHLGRHPLQRAERAAGGPGGDGTRLRHHRAPAEPDLLVVEGDVGPRTRTGDVRPHADRAAGQGLRGAPADRRPGHRPLRRLQHQRLRPGSRRLVGGVAGRRRGAAGAVPRGGGLDHRRRPRHHRRGPGHRAGARHPGGAGRRRRSDGRPRGRDRVRGVRRVRLSRLLLVGVGGRRYAAARPADAQHDLQPRHPRPLRPDRHHAGRWRVAGMGGGHLGAWSGEPLHRVAGRRRGGRGQRGRASISCRTCSASGRRTGIRRRGRCSPAWPSTTGRRT